MRTVRLVHTPNWEYADKVKTALDSNNVSRAVSVPVFWVPIEENPYKLLPIYSTAFFCNHCNDWWHVWSPKDHKVLPYSDGGPCDKCQKWKTKNGDLLKWCEMSNQHILNVASYLQRSIKEYRILLRISKGKKKIARRKDTRLILKDLELQRSFAITEMKYRNLIPSLQELNIICDLILERGINLDKPDPYHGDFLNLWAKYAKEVRTVI